MSSLLISVSHLTKRRSSRNRKEIQGALNLASQSSSRRVAAGSNVIAASKYSKPRWQTGPRISDSKQIPIMDESLSTTSVKGGQLPNEPETQLETSRTPIARGPRISKLSNISKEGTEDYFHDAEGEIAGHEGGTGSVVPPPVPPKEEQQRGKQPSRKRHQELTASNLQAIPNAEELAPGIRLGAGGNVDPEPAEPGQSAPPSSSGHAAYSEEGDDDERPHILDADTHLLDSEIDEHGRRHSLLTSASGGRAAEESFRAPSLGPSASARGAPSVPGPAGRRQGPMFSNTVGHFGKGGEPVGA
jgi:hypothetical protein